MIRTILSLGLSPLLIAGLTCFGVGAMKSSADDRQPNVLFMMADDLNNSLGCYGHPMVKTPNIDRIAARGVRFERSYCQFPLCGPSRNSMLTGLYPNSTGIHANSIIFRQTIPSHQSLSQAFRLDGYFAARIGKLYHYNVPNSIGTAGHDDPGSWELELNPAGCDRLIEEPDIFSLRPGSFGGTLSWFASPRDDAEHTDGMLAENARWVLQRCAQKKDRPFFLAVGFFRPHTPYVAPKKYFEPYKLEEMPLVQNVDEDVKDIPEPGLGSRKPEHDDLTDPLRREAIQAYYASTTFMDAQVGMVLDALDEFGLADNTIIVFTSDHGYHLGEHGLWQKQSLFEESARVPLIVSAPGIEGGQVSEAPVGLIDLYPTLTELCGVKAPENLQGQSLVPIMKDTRHFGRGFAVSQVMRGTNKKKFFGYSLRTPRWRYTEWADGEQGRELYDHEADPKELTNLANRDEHASTMKELSATLQTAIKGTFPSDGKIPPIDAAVWAPNLTHP